MQRNGKDCAPAARTSEISFGEFIGVTYF